MVGNLFGISENEEYKAFLLLSKGKWAAGAIVMHRTY